MYCASASCYHWGKWGVEREQGSLCARRGPSHRGCTNMSKGRGQRMLPAASPGDHGHTDTAPWCVSVHKLLPCDSGALRTPGTLNPRAWPCALTCAFRKQAAQADPARMSTFLYLELGLKGHLQPAARPLAGWEGDDFPKGKRRNWPPTPTPPSNRSDTKPFELEHIWGTGTRGGRTQDPPPQQHPLLPPGPPPSTPTDNAPGVRQ